MPLANRVKELRAAKGLNQQELGALVGGLWLTQTLSYLLRAYKLEHGKAKTE